MPAAITLRATPFPKRVGVQPKSGLRFGNKEVKTSNKPLITSGTDEKNKGIQELLIAFERRPSMETAKQIMISYYSLDDMSMIPKVVIDRIVQFLNKL